MSNTFWAIRRRELAKKEPVKAKPAKAVVEEPSYRDLQAKAKELEIPANQSAEELKDAIEDAEADESAGS